MEIFTLTTGPDTFVGGAGANTVYGTAATLNAGDSLTGGSGNNVLELIGSGKHLRRAPLLEVFIAAFFDAVTEIARGGLLRRYRRDHTLRPGMGR